MAVVNFESVATAAEALQTAGQRASVRAVTAAIGGGSPNTILKLLNDWKSGRPVVRIADTELDAKITDAIKTQMQRVAEQAAATAEEKAAGIEEDLQALAEAQAAAEQQITMLTTERDEAQAQSVDFIEQLKEAKAEAQRTAEQVAVTVNDLRKELAGERQRFETTAATLARAEVRLEVVPGLEADLNASRIALDSERTAKVVAEQAAAVAMAKLDAANQTIDRAAQQSKDLLIASEQRTTKAETAIESLTAKLDASMRDLVHANAVIQTSQSRLEAATREIDDLKKAATEARLEAKKSVEEAAELRGTIAQIKTDAKNGTSSSS